MPILLPIVPICPRPDCRLSLRANPYRIYWRYVGWFPGGYTILLLKRYIRLPQSMQGLMPIMVLPVLSTIIGGLLMMTLIGKPIAWLQEALIHLLESMQGGSRFLMGALLGAMATFDFGGRSTKPCRCFPMACWSVASTDQKRENLSAQSSLRLASHFRSY